MDIAGSAGDVAGYSRAQRRLRERDAAFSVTVIFASTLFVSAGLLFVVEPMFAKMVLPRLGGSPAVWNTCVVFFQAVMLAAYGYAHLSTRWLSLRLQVVTHVTLIAVAALTLPVVIPDTWGAAAEHTPIVALTLLLAVTLGAPFFVLASTAPLLQRWYSHTRLASAGDPYFLYGASNLGSMVALLAYPFVLEPRWPISTQSAGWTLGYFAFGGLTAACAVSVLRNRAASGGPDVAGMPASEVAGPAPTWRQRGRWLLLAAVPSSLLLAVTTFLSTDVAATPLLWTIPLVLYLLTFVLAFSGRRLLTPRFAGRAVTLLVTVLVAAISIGLREPVWLSVPLHLAGFLVCALVLHSALAQERPSAARLTEFYLWISVGGLAGGVFNTLLAPLLFSSVAEYPLALLLALFLRPRLRAESPAPAFNIGMLVLPLALAGTVAGLVWAFKTGTLGNVGLSIGCGLTGILYAACARHPRRLALGLLLVVVGVPRASGAGELAHQERTFFGVHRVTIDRDARRHRLYHGSTLHGEQDFDPARRREPLTYYHRTGPIGQTIAAMSDRLQNVAVVGLGAGSLAAYAIPGQAWTFFEIDPAIERLARTNEFFTYLNDCGSTCQVVLGDARLSMGKTRATYDLIVLDAFSSDAIPTHLLTREALSLYISRLSAEGVIAFHISNRYLDLRPVIGALAAEMQLQTRVQIHRPEPETGVNASAWVIAARSPEALGALAVDGRWEELTMRSARTWTDDYSDVLGVLGGL